MAQVMQSKGTVQWLSVSILALGVHDNFATVLGKERSEGILPLGHGELVADDHFWLHLKHI